MKFSEIYLLTRAIPKTIYFNFRYFKFRTAIKMPVLISHNVRLLKTKGKVIIENSNPTLFDIRIGFGDVGIFDKQRSRTIWENSGVIIFKGRASIGHGSKISVAGLLEIGNNFRISAESSIVCFKQISIGHDVLMSWETLIMDTDFHIIKNHKDEIINNDKEIIIGNKVWIGCRCTILKGTIIGDGNVVAANSVVTANYNNENSIIGGNPIRTLKDKIYWMA
ncbi:acyltransferase [Gottfriedia acidiceleris]|uniref:acyltransferase n=1 Tax=Gottfriedia acidiceleris TaxID=371036 RepID=UPI001BAEAF80|nr:acyltransferase [Gottfriedia acidiceleris]